MITDNNGVTTWATGVPISPEARRTGCVSGSALSLKAQMPVTFHGVHEIGLW